MAGEKTPSHKAMDRPMIAPQSGCLGQARLLSRTAFVPGERGRSRCGKLLSTETLLSTRHWDRT